MNTQTVKQDTSIYRIKDLVKTYDMGEVAVQALRGITLDIYEGEFLVILGHSGSGKSTLLNIIGGIDSPTSGTVEYGNQTLSSFTENQLTQYRRKHIGFIFQFYNLMPNLTAKENVEMATEISEDPMPAMEALELVGLEGRESHFPAQLSGGEQQRVSIARAIAKRPRILFCDEPTGSLDISTGKVVLEVLMNVNQKMGTTLLVITHNASIAEVANRVIHMRDGMVQTIENNVSPITLDEVVW